MPIVRSILAIVSGLVLLSLVAEGIEMAVVTALNGSFTQDQTLYFGIRNRPAVLMAKLVYNTGAAFLAGYAAAWIAGRAPLLHAVILTIVQLAAFVWGMVFSEFAGTTPVWAWLTLMPLMASGIILGAFVQNRRRHTVRSLALGVALLLLAGPSWAQAPDTDRPEPLVCRPTGQGPFATVIWNHGLVRDRATFANAQRGWQNMCAAIAADGYLAYVPIRRFAPNLGPAEIRREADELAKVVNNVIAMPDVDRAKIVLMGHSRGATLALMVGVTRRDLAAIVLTAPAPIPPRFLGDTLARVRSTSTPVLLMVENGDELGGLAAVRDIDAELKRRRNDDHRTLRYDRGGGHFLFIKKDYWWDDFRTFLDERLKR